MAAAQGSLEDDERREKEDLINFINNNSLSDILAFLLRKMDSLTGTVQMEHDLNIGVIGSPGVEKSTFINTIRRLRPTDHGAAPTDVVQTVMKPTAYEHPRNPSVKFWELSGCGTANFSRDKYIEMTKSTQFDFYIIICCSRFTGNDLFFAKEMEKAKKQFYFVRTKTDIDIRNYRQDYPQTPSKEVLKIVRGDCIANFSAFEIKKPFVFFVCKDPLAYDLSLLENILINNLPERTRQAVLLTLWSVSPDVIEAKAVQLHQRSWWAAVASAAACAAACTAASAAASEVASEAAFAAVTEVADHQLPIMMDVLCKELKFYKEVLGLDELGLKQLSKSASVREEILVDAIKEYFWTNVSEDTLLNAMKSWYAKGDAKIIKIPMEDAIALKLPCFTKIKAFLGYLIECMKKVMLDVLEIARAPPSEY